MVRVDTRARVLLDTLPKDIHYLYGLPRLQRVCRDLKSVNDEQTCTMNLQNSS
jgi:hypothetical protein